MNRLEQPALILRAVPFEERHQMVTLLTENLGRITGVARNSIQSRRFGGALQLFSASDCTLVGKEGTEVYRIDAAETRRSFEGIRRDWNRYVIASFLTELLLKLAPESESAPELFRLHANTLAYLEDEVDVDRVKALRLISANLLKLLQWSGQAFGTAGCEACGRADGSLKLGLTSGKLRCADCAMPREAGQTERSAYLSENERMWMEHVYSHPLKTSLQLESSDPRQLMSPQPLFELLLEWSAAHLTHMDLRLLKSFSSLEAAL